MRRIAVISYTERGGQLNERLIKYLQSRGDVVVSYTGSQDMTFPSARSLLEQEWNRTNAFIFVGAMGIVVRQIAPFLKDKTKDPAVLVLDEAALFVIPVLSGHIGGGVALSRQAAEFLGAQAVITTATDVEGRFAVDVFAENNHLRIQDPAAAKAVSAAILRGETVEVCAELKMSGDVPKGIKFRGVSHGSLECDCMPGERTAGRCLINNICFQCADGKTCVLTPRCYIVGIGCKKGKSADDLEGMLGQICEKNQISTEQIAGIASIDAKKEEAGIWELSRRLRVPYEVFTAEELEQIDESVSASEFVRQTVGVDNVCERSALCLAERWCGQSSDDDGFGGEQVIRNSYADVDNTPRQDTLASASCRLIVKKQARDGMTMAVAQFSQKEYRW